MLFSYLELSLCALKGANEALRRSDFVSYDKYFSAYEALLSEGASRARRVLYV